MCLHVNRCKSDAESVTKSLYKTINFITLENIHIITVYVSEKETSLNLTWSKYKQRGCELQH